ncbi:hypothetical protein KUF71_017319, partial [Frankliniella fusca]
IDVLEEKQLPSYERFFSSLRASNITREEYEQCQRVFQMFNCESIKDFLTIYVIVDVLLLACCFQRFRAVNYSNYNLDCLHYISSPSYYFSACLKMCNISLELLTNIDDYLMIESGIRGGLSQVFNRHSTPNNPYMSTFDPSAPTSYGLLLDHNSLYAAAQWAYKMPIGNFQILSNEEIRDFDIFSVDVNGDKEYQRELLKKQNMRYPKNSVKLIASQRDKNNLVIHLAPLQSWWLRKWIETNTEIRKRSATKIESDTAKKSINATFGSFLLSKRKQRKVVLLGSEKALARAVKRPLFTGFTIINENLSAVEYKPLQIVMDRPYILGFCTLEHAKAIFYAYYYFTLKPFYCDRITLNYVDTDSYFVTVVTKDVYQDLENIPNVDTSNYPQNHRLHSLSNKSRLLCVKDELGGCVVEEAIFIKSKCYAIRTKEDTKKKLKGVARVARRGGGEGGEEQEDKTELIADEQEDEDTPAFRLIFL